jgi:hypothetical protein
MAVICLILAALLGSARVHGAPVAAPAAAPEMSDAAPAEAPAPADSLVAAPAPSSVSVATGYATRTGPPPSEHKQSPSKA